MVPSIPITFLLQKQTEHAPKALGAKVDRYPSMFKVFQPPLLPGSAAHSLPECSLSPHPGHAFLSCLCLCYSLCLRFSPQRTQVAWLLLVGILNYPKEKSSAAFALSGLGHFLPSISVAHQVQTFAKGRASSLCREHCRHRKVKVPANNALF